MTSLDQPELIKVTVEDFVHEPGRGTPLTRNRLESGKTFHVVATEGIAVGQEIQMGPSAKPEIGNVLPVGKIPAGSFVSNLELLPGDGGKLVRASGTYAAVVSHTPEGTLVKLPSGKSLYMNDLCLATMGLISGSGRTDRPFLKAGKKQAWMTAKGPRLPH